MSKPEAFNYDDYKLLLVENEAMKKNEAAWQKEIRNLTEKFEACRNELCLKCGNFHNAFRGTCHGCRWYE